MFSEHCSRLSEWRCLQLIAKFCSANFRCKFLTKIPLISQNTLVSQRFFSEFWFVQEFCFVNNNKETLTKTIINTNSERCLKQILIVQRIFYQTVWNGAANSFRQNRFVTPLSVGSTVMTSLLLPLAILEGSIFFSFSLFEMSCLYKKHFYFCALFGKVSKKN